MTDYDSVTVGNASSIVQDVSNFPQAVSEIFVAHLPPDY